jgi:hypothetical protein
MTLLSFNQVVPVWHSFPLLHFVSVVFVRWTPQDFVSIMCSNNTKTWISWSIRHCLFNPFQSGSLGTAHRRADKPRRNWAFLTAAAWRDYLSPWLWANSRSSFCITPYILIWSCKLLRKSDSSHPTPPPRYSLLHHRATAKSGAVLAFTQHFGHEDFIATKIVLEVL